MHSASAMAYFPLSNEIAQQRNKLQEAPCKIFFDTVMDSFFLSYQTYFIHAQEPICQKWKSTALMYFPHIQAAMLQSSTIKIRHMCRAEWWINMQVFWHTEQEKIAHSAGQQVWIMHMIGNCFTKFTFFRIPWHDVEWRDQCTTSHIQLDGWTNSW